MVNKLRFIALIVLISVLCPGLAYGAADLASYKFNTSVNVNLNTKTDFVLLRLEQKILDTFTQTDENIRIYANKKELGYLNVTLNYEKWMQNKESGTFSVINKGLTDDDYSFTIIVPESLTGKDLDYSFELNKNKYMINAQVFGSNSLEDWQLVQEETLYGIDYKHCSFKIPNINYKYLKIAYKQDSKEPLELTNAKYSYIDNGYISPVISEINQDTKIQTVNFNTVNESKKTAVSVDLGSKHILTNKLLVNTADRNFYREALLESSNDNKNWQVITRTFIYNNDKCNKTDMEYNLTGGRYLRLTILNEDNAPLNIEKIEIQKAPYLVLVNVTDLGNDFPLDVYWGSESLAKPQYDIEKLISAQSDKGCPLIKIDSYRTNPLFQDKQLPLSERFPWLLPVSLFGLIALAGIILFRNIKDLKN